jgi:hypothetical protein
MEEIPRPPVALDRARQRELLWGVAGEPTAAAWPDCSVRRPLGLEYDVGRATLVDGRISRRVVPAHPRGSAPGHGGRGWLALAAAGPVTTGDEVRWRGALHVGRCGRVVTVEVVLAPWSTSTSELRLQLRHRAELPRRYFDVAHGVMDSLRAEVQRRAGLLMRPS